MHLTFIDIFAGMGNIRLGLEKAGHTCIYSIEWDKHKRRIYSVIFGNEPESSDIRAVRGKDLPRADLWSFGFPCQDISVAGRQLGLTGSRSGMFYEVMRLLLEIAKENKPRYLLIENVKNLLSINGGWDFLNLLLALDEVGYDAEWEVLNSKHFGVPQNRERIYIVGHLRGQCTRQIFPFSRTGGGLIEQIGNVMPTATRKNPNQGRVYAPTGISPTLTKAEGGSRTPFVRDQGRPIKIQIATCLLASYRKGPDNHGERTLIFEGKKGVRKLTPRECLRLQAVDDKIIDRLLSSKISDTQLYRAAGDAVTVNVAYEIGLRL